MYGHAKWHRVAWRGGRREMRDYRERAGFVVAGLLLVSACSSSGSDEAATTVATDAPVTTPEAPATTQTTLSDFQIEQAAIEAAEAEIETAVIGWYTYPYDTSLGEAGLPLEFATGPLYQRLVDLGESRTAAGEIQRSLGGDAIELVDIRVDLDDGIADIDVCSHGNHEVVDAETGDQVALDADESWEGQAQARLVDGVWLIEDFSSDQANGGNQCVLSE